MRKDRVEMSVSVAAWALAPLSRPIVKPFARGFGILILALAATAPALAVDAARAFPSQRDLLAGPVEARVIQVRDGDTFRVRARIWVGQEIVINVRLAGIDTPELRGRCASERALAKRARAFVARAVGDRPVRLSQIRNGKYAGRVLARVETQDGIDLGAALSRAGLARAYGGGRRPGWCG
jgi:endonuclease YncB( thermonuclease family)